MSGIPWAQEKGLHNHFIKKKLHDRIRHLTPANIRALDRARTPAENAMPDWLTTKSPRIAGSLHGVKSFCLSNLRSTL
jgi:hypothetical protein